MSKKVVFIAPYPRGQAPSQRFRFEQYFEFLKNEGYTIEFYSFLSDSTWQKLYKQGSFFGKSMGILGSFLRRFKLLFKLRKSDYIFIHREASMIGPPIFEWIIAKVLCKKFIYDFDDAIWLPNYSESNARFHKLKAYGKVKRIIKWADTVSVGNTYLKEYAEQFNNNVVVIPTTIDLTNVHNIDSDHTKAPVNLIWTGTHTTMIYLEPILPILKELSVDHSFVFTIISNKKPDFEFDFLKFVQWNKTSEIDDLSKGQIGVMPLIENKWSKGKCGFKALQYMSLSIPAVVSPVGVNNDIINHESNGYLCSTPEDWKKTLSLLIKDASLREQLGKAGKQTIQLNYSVEANKDKYLKLFKK